MKKIYLTIKKNFKILFKSKLSLFLLLFSPIILIYIIGFFYFNASSFSINIGVHSPDNSKFNAFFLNEIKKSQFNIFQYNSTNQCEDKLKSGLLHSCIYLPKNYSISDNSQNQIELKLDTTKGEIIKISENLINDQLSKILTQIQIEHMQELLDLINESKYLVQDTNSLYQDVTNDNNNIDDLANNLEKKSNEITKLYNPKNINAGKLVLSSENLNNSLNNLAGSGYDLANDSKLAIINLSDSIDNQSAQTKKLLSQIENNNDDILTKFNTLQSPYFYRQLNDLINELYEKLNSAEDSAGDISGDLSSNVDKISKNLDEINEKLEEYILLNKNYLNSINNLESTNAKSLISPVSIHTSYLTPNNTSQLMSLFPSLIIGLVFIISLILSSMFTLIDKKNKGSFRMILSNNSSINYFIANFITLFSVVLTQASLIICLYYFWFLKNFSVEFLYFILLVCPVIIIFILLGMIIGFLSKSESTNIILVFSVITGFLSFSGKLIPLESLSSKTIEFLSNNPLLIGESIIRKYLLFNIPISQMNSEFSTLILIILILTIICLLFESFNKRNFLHQLYCELVLYFSNKFHKSTNIEKTKKDHKKLINEMLK